jgi:hypothetical protein
MWDYDQQAAARQGKADPVWKLERMINYGLDGERIDRRLLEKYLPVLNISADKRAFLELILWNKY